MLAVVINDPYTLRRVMHEVGRDHFTIKAYEILFEYFNTDDTIIDFDPVAIDCEFCEEDISEIEDKYNHIEELSNIDWSDDEEICAALNEHTSAWITNNRTILYAEF